MSICVDISEILRHPLQHHRYTANAAIASPRNARRHNDVGRAMLPYWSRMSKTPPLFSASAAFSPVLPNNGPGAPTL